MKAAYRQLRTLGTSKRGEREAREVGQLHSIPFLQSLVAPPWAYFNHWHTSGSTSESSTP